MVTAFHAAVRGQPKPIVFTELMAKDDDPQSMLAAVGYTIIGSATAGIVIASVNAIAKRAKSETTAASNTNSRS